jgi:hypothetical protein
MMFIDSRILDDDGYSFLVTGIKVAGIHFQYQKINNN